MGSISSLLHTLQVSWNAACSIFRHVWTGFSAVRLPPSLLAVSPSVSLPLAGPGSLKWRPNINICHTDGKEEVQLSLTSSFFPRFSSSVTCLLISYCFLPPPPSRLLKTFCPFVYLSHASFLRLLWHLTPPGWLAFVEPAYPRWHF